MIRASLRSLVVIVAMASLGTGLAGCSTEPGDSADGSADPSATAVAAPSSGEDLAAGTVHEDCMVVSLYSTPHADITDVDSMPADWPEPPEGSLLCATTESGETESAAYANDLAIDEVLAYYTTALPSSYQTTLLSGEETGTGYATLDGTDGQHAFQISENDGGFTLTFAFGGAA